MTQSATTRRLRVVRKHENSKKVRLLRPDGTTIVAKVVGQDGNDLILCRPGHKTTFRRGINAKVTMATATA